MAHLRHFSKQEVNALIPSLCKVFDRIRALSQEIAARANELERLGYSRSLGDPGDNRPEVAERREIIARRVADFDSEISKIGDVGGILKDLDLGVVDFPTTVDGTEAFLCWQVGEDGVAHYHLPGDDFSGRRPLPT